MSDKVRLTNELSSLLFVLPDLLRMTVEQHNSLPNATLLQRVVIYSWELGGWGRGRGQTFECSTHTARVALHLEVVIILSRDGK